jgi:DNA-binding Xre family transcriptional regulator
MHLIQVAFRETEYDRAIRILRAHLDENGLRGHERCSIDRTRFRALRKLRRVTLQQLANALGITPAAVSSLEGRNGRLRFERLLLAAALLDVRPADFLSAGVLPDGASGVTHQ